MDRAGWTCFEQRLRPDARELAPLRRALTAFLLRALVAEAFVSDLVLATSEIASNAIVHSGTSDDVSILVRARVSPRKVEIDVYDAGRWLPRDATRPSGGRGLDIARAVGALDIACSEHGTTVTLRSETTPRDVGR